jgi:hypothetical protein
MEAIQIGDGNNRSPLLPADQLKEVSFEMQAEEARHLNNFYKEEPKSKRRKRGFIHGALYHNLFAGYYEIDPQATGDVDIVVNDQKTKSTTTVMVRLVRQEEELLTAIIELGVCMPAKGTCRRDVGDIGEMYGLGYRSKAKGVLYKQTRDGRTAGAMKQVSDGVVRYMSQHYEGVLADIKKAEKGGAPAPALHEMGGLNGPGGTIMLSRNLGNSAHYDFADRSHSFAIWVEKIFGQAGNWYFILPNVSVNGSKGAVIRLRHGTAISWDGRKIRHCTSVTDVGEGNDVFGCMFGSCRD